MSLQCWECGREFTVKSNLTRHLRMIHNTEVERIDILPADFDVYHYKCLEGCNISFKYNRELRNHLKDTHEFNLVELNLEFPNSQEFNKWLQNEESENYVQYVHLTATKKRSTGAETYYYECSRTGKRVPLDETTRKRKARKWVMKLNRGCTSQIIANKSHNGSYSVSYFKTHYGHEIGVEQINLSKQDRGAIASKLLLGLPISTVLHSAKTPKGNLKRINLLGTKDVFNIRRSFKINLKNGKVANVDTLNVKSFLAECSAHEKNPVLYCHLADSSQSDDLSFILMSKYQAEVLVEMGNSVLVVDSTSLHNCDFELIMLFVISKTLENFPVACLFTNKVDASVYDLFFIKIKERVGELRPTMIVTNCDEMYYQSWNKVMGGDAVNIYNPNQVDVDWKSNLNRVVCTENEVTKIKRKWVFDTLKTLQTNGDEADFLENFDATLKVLSNDPDLNQFYQYFVEKYRDPKKWAECFFKDMEVPNKPLEIVSYVMQQYLNEQVETRFDKIFHSFVRFIRDETVNSMLKLETGRAFFVEENNVRHAAMTNMHFTGTHSGENIWNVDESDCDSTHIVQKYFEKKCCNLVCSSCRICLHCFSCTCVDFFVGNAMCVHIHYVWVTYFQSIVNAQSEDSCDEKGPSCDEEIIIEIDQDGHEQDSEVEDSVETLRNAIVEKNSILTQNINSVESKNILRVILDNLNQLCEISACSEEELKQDEKEECAKDILDDHAYL